MGQFSSFLKAWNGSRRADLTLLKHHSNPFKNQNYPPFFWNSSSVSSFRLPCTGLILPCLLEPKELYSKWAKSDPKIVLYFTHRNGPIFGSKTDLFDLQCIIANLPRIYEVLIEKGMLPVFFRWDSTCKSNPKRQESFQSGNYFIVRLNFTEAIWTTDFT